MVLTHMTASAGSRTCLDIEDQEETPVIFGYKLTYQRQSKPCGEAI